MIKSKPCIVEDCENPRWGKGYCKRHQSLRTDKKPKGLKKRTEKGQVKVDLKKELVSNDMSFYLQIWMERAHVCEECGIDLGNRPSLYMFDHILEKSKHPLLRHVKANIQILCLQCHGTKTNGLHSKRIKERIEELKSKFC